MNVLLELHVGQPSAGIRSSMPLGSQNGTSWQQHLEQAQAAGWFCRADRLQTARTEPAVTPAAWQSAATPANVPAPGAGTEARADVAVDGQSAQRVGERDSTSMPLSRGQQVNSEDRHFQSEACATSAAAPTCTSNRASLPSRRVSEVKTAQESLSSCVTQERARLRLHVEADLVGLHVWLGLEGTTSEVAARAASLAPQVRASLERSGARVASVTCNGTPLYSCAVPAREEP